MLTKILITASYSWWDFSNFNFLHCLIPFPFDFQIGREYLGLLGLPWWLRWWRIQLRCRRLRVKNLPANAGDVRDAGSIPGSGTSPGEGNGCPLQHSCLGKSMDRGGLVGYTPRGCKESDMTRNTHTHTHADWAISTFTFFCSLVSQICYKYHRHDACDGLE